MFFFQSKVWWISGNQSLATCTILCGSLKVFALCFSQTEQSGKAETSFRQLITLGWIRTIRLVFTKASTKKQNKKNIVMYFYFELIRFVSIGRVCVGCYFDGINSFHQGFYHRLMVSSMAVSELTRQTSICCRPFPLQLFWRWFTEWGRDHQGEANRFCWPCGERCRASMRRNETAWFLFSSL